MVDPVARPPYSVREPGQVFPNRRLLRILMRVWLVRSLTAVVILAGVALVTGIATLMFGRVTGTEFAPDSFEHREYSYYELPIVRLKITPVWRTTSRSDFEQKLVNDGSVVPVNPPARWDLVRAFRRGQIWREGDAQILQEYLAPYGPSSQYWTQWSDREPKLAAVLWPEVAKAARADLYILVPDLFEIAATSSDPGKLTADLNARLARRYEELAEVEMALEHFGTAERFFATALSYEPERATSLAGRDRARELGSTGPQPETADPPPDAMKAERDPGP